ncbi:hypothetical protein Bbelb_183280 [Branchiostoma belcheri]|nr:hypothetical protein Bbelb_183280 [Branchiostoma belcheri]
MYPLREFRLSELIVHAVTPPHARRSSLGSHSALGHNFPFTFRPSINREGDWRAARRLDFSLEINPVWLDPPLSTPTYRRVEAARRTHLRQYCTTTSASGVQDHYASRHSQAGTFRTRRRLEDVLEGSLCSHLRFKVTFIPRERVSYLPTPVLRPAEPPARRLDPPAPGQISAYPRPSRLTRAGLSLPRGLHQGH